MGLGQRSSTKKSHSANTGRATEAVHCPTVAAAAPRDLDGRALFGIDAEGTEKIEALLSTMREKYTVVIVTHNMAQARRASDECIYMLMGELIEHDLTSELFFNPKHEKTEMYIQGRYG